ncbi:hypothetical protein [Paenibacillus sp. NPDC058071]|uniref:hypothetical protein n=1 Tax=Paenibacillus sp. NPDC058071 TaxID=3346326 RepID=UPI0036D98A3A
MRRRSVHSVALPLSESSSSDKPNDLHASSDSSTTRTIDSLITAMHGGAEELQYDAAAWQQILLALPAEYTVPDMVILQPLRQRLLEVG